MTKAGRKRGDLMPEGVCLFPVAAVTHYHKHDGLKSQSQLWRPEV